MHSYLSLALLIQQGAQRSTASLSTEEEGEAEIAGEESDVEELQEDVATLEDQMKECTAR